MRVTIEDHDPLWKDKFLEIREQLLHALADVPDVASVEHVGSTAVPSLKAKPVLDIDVVVPAASVPAARLALARAGYTDCHDTHVPGRHVFRQPGFGKQDAAHGYYYGGPGEDGEGEQQQQQQRLLRHNTYVMEEGCSALRNHLDVRRVLTEDAELRDEYGRIKAELAGVEFESMHGYVCGKTEVLCKILRRAGWGEDELEPLIRANS
ncbi:hypothetical protein N3K66_002890 [Trichothecium roseum]|uniref:Uncharacterized protein n=1 Tax=Trichothecium roseum TaxID=47278 RepID=A0ACC0V3X2_9HYPO|nr:hypothetical protein N3K66_002890 [Trichothecium roseum]